MNIVIGTNLNQLKKKKLEKEDMENVIISLVLNGAESLPKTTVQAYTEWEITNFVMNLDFVNSCMVDEYVSDDIHTVSKIEIKNLKEGIKLITKYIKQLLDSLQKYNAGVDEDLQYNEDITILLVGEPSVTKKLSEILNKQFVENKMYYSERDERNRPIYLETIDFLANFSVADMTGLNTYLVRNYRISDMDLLDPIEVAYTVSSCINMPKTSLD